MTLREKQSAFTRMVADLIIWAYSQGYELTFGECWRTKQQAEWNAAKGIGINRSLHCDRLAVDLLLFINGKYTTKPVDYEPLGLMWESLGGAWGGRFGDYQHFSLAHGGRK